MEITEKQVKDNGYSIAASQYMVVVACPNMGKKCSLRKFLANNPDKARVVMVPGTKAVTLRVMGEPEELAKNSEDLYNRAKKICDMCMRSQGVKQPLR